MSLPPLLEKHVSRPVTDFLWSEGWRLLRNNVTRQKLNGRWTQFGETGMPDYLAIRYLPDSLAVVLWLEFKRPKRGGLSLEQQLWHARERKDGGTICIVSDYESFREFYRERFDRADSPVKGQRELIGRKQERV